MNKTSLGGQYDLTASYVALNTLLGVAADMLGKIELSIDPSHAATVFLELSDADNPVQISAGVGYTHEFSAVKLSTVRVKGTLGDSVALVGETVERMVQGAMY